MQLLKGKEVDHCWNVVNSRYNLPQGFLQRHYNLDLVNRCDERLLPRWPISPGPFALEEHEMLIRPELNDSFRSLFPTDALIYDSIRHSKVPNYRGVRIKLNPNFNPSIWHEILKGYDDLQVIDFMAFGWPASYECDKIPSLGLPNHSSSVKNEGAVEKYLRKEVDSSAMLGPLVEVPFKWFRTNPMMVRPKKEPGKFRVILDLSFPLGSSVNSYIPNLSYDGAPYKLRLPTALDLAEIISKHGTGSYLYKLDLARAYRQLPADPLDWPLLGIKWNDTFYMDKSVPFGLRPWRPLL